MKTLTMSVMLAALTLSACSVEDIPEQSDAGDNAQVEPGQTADPSTPATSEDEPDEIPEEDSPDPADMWEHLVYFEEPYRYESSGVVLVVDGVGFTSADQFDESTQDFFDDDTQTIAGANVIVSNDSGQTIHFYPGQATIRVAREQADAALFLSDSIAGNDWQNETDDEGFVVWELETPVDDVYAAGEMSFTVSAPRSAESFEALGDEVQMTMQWTPTS